MVVAKKRNSKKISAKREKDRVEPKFNLKILFRKFQLFFLREFN